MLSRWQKRTLLALVWCYLIGVGGWLSWRWSSGLPPYSQPYSAHAQYTEEESDKLAIERRLAYYTFWLAWFTAILAGSTVGLWVVTDKIFRHGREIDKQQLRAYISVEPNGIRKLYPAKTEVLAHVGFHNTGSIFAKNVYIFLDTKLSENGNESDFPIDELSGKIVIAPHATIFSGTNKSFPISEIEARMTSTGALYLYVWGIVHYHDGFIDGRFTKFCHRYNFRGRPQGRYRLRAKQGRYHQYGNEIDDKD